MDADLFGNAMQGQSRQLPVLGQNTEAFQHIHGAAFVAFVEGDTGQRPVGQQEGVRSSGALDHIQPVREQGTRGLGLVALQQRGSEYWGVQARNHAAAAILLLRLGQRRAQDRLCQMRIAIPEMTEAR